jgi:hypothetical protein
MKVFFNRPETLFVKTVSLQPATRPGLPDGIFSNQNSNFGYILEGLGMDTVGVYLMVIWNIYYARLVLHLAKSGNPAFRLIRSCNFQASFIPSRVARFFLAQHTKTGKNIPNDYKIYQVATKYTKWPYIK